VILVLKDARARQGRPFEGIEIAKPSAAMGVREK
jgi:hypothetical protein